MSRRMTIALTALLTAVVTVGALMWAFHTALADVPRAPSQPAAPPVPASISYQGQLTEPGTGNPVSDGVYTMTFSIYDVFTGGVPLWTQTSAVHVTDGLFNAKLGTHANPLNSDVFSGGSRWLGISVDPDPDEMVPRQGLNSVPYALRAESLRVGGLVSATSSGPIYRFINSGSGPALLVTNVGSGLALAANGDVQVGGDAYVDGSLSWYTRTGHISVSPAEFEPYTVTQQYIKKGRSLEAISGSNYYAPLDLPDGATVSRMTFYYRDAADTSGVVTMTLKRGPVDGTTSDHEDMAQVGSHTDGYSSGADPSIDNPVVDNENYIYWLYAKFAGSLDEYRRVMAVVIEYQYSEPY